MIERETFLKALAENEDDVPSRMVYADWLEEKGEHEEAERQRQWPAAKAWFVRFCEEHNPSPDEEDAYEMVLSYQDLIEMGRYALTEPDSDGYGVICGNNDSMSYALEDHKREFWKNWSIMTGIPLPPDVEERSYFSCAC